MRLVDPVEWYMRKDEVRLDGLGWVDYAPLSYQRQDSESVERGDASARLPPPSESPLEDWEERKTGLSEQYKGYFAARARDVVAGQPAVIRTAKGTVRARLVRFRNGAVLECDVLEPGRTGHGMTRVGRRALRDPVRVIENYLMDEVAKLGPGAEPMT